MRSGWLGRSLSSTGGLVYRVHRSLIYHASHVFRVWRQGAVLSLLKGADKMTARSVRARRYSLSFRGVQSIVATVTD